MDDVRKADEVDDELRGNAEDDDEDYLGDLSEGVVDEDALEEAVEEEVWSGGSVCWVGDKCVYEDARAEGEEEGETSRELHKESNGHTDMRWVSAVGDDPATASTRAGTMRTTTKRT